MIAFPSLLSLAAKKAGMKVPAKIDDYEDDLLSYKSDFPHFYVFCLLQLDRPMNPNDHWENAKVIASLSEEQIRTFSEKDFIKRGCKFI